MLEPLRAVAANPGLRRAVAAYVGFNVGEWATWIAILVFAFEQGGTTEAGVVALVQLAPATIVAPVAATLGDRLPRERLLLLGYLVQAASMATTAVALTADLPRAFVYAAAAVTASCLTLTRPAHGSIVPMLARTPAEVTAANVVSGIVQTASLLVAPAIAGILVGTSGAGSVFALTAAGCAVSALLVAGLRVDRTGLVPLEPGGGSVVGELSGGLRDLASMRHPRSIVALLGAAGILEGATDIFIVLLALDLLDLGEAGAGFMNAAVGAGGLIGAALAMSLVGRTRLAVPFAVGLVAAGVPLAVAGILPMVPVTFAALVILGAGRSVMDVAGRTLLQRVTPDRSLGRAFGVLEGMHQGMTAVGSIAVPALLLFMGPTVALLVAGMWLPIVLATGWRALGSADSAAVVHDRELELLRGLPMFAGLPPPTIERLSSRLEPRAVQRGGWIIRQGEPGHRFYLLDRGEVEVLIDDRLVRTQGPGDSFGEIALLRDVPRTASVRARDDVLLYALAREDFLAAIAGHAEGRRVAEGLASERLGRPSGGAPGR